MPKDNVTSLAVASQDNRKWTIEDMLEHALKQIREGSIEEIEPSQAILLIQGKSSYRSIPYRLFVNNDYDKRVALLQSALFLEMHDNLIEE